MEGRPCRMRVLAGAGVWGTGRVVTHTGLGWMGGLVLRMVLAFNVAEPGRTSGENTNMSIRIHQRFNFHVTDFIDVLTCFSQRVNQPLTHMEVLWIKPLIEESIVMQMTHNCTSLSCQMHCVLSLAVSLTLMYR